MIHHYLLAKKEGRSSGREAEGVVYSASVVASEPHPRMSAAEASCPPPVRQNPRHGAAAARNEDDTTAPKKKKSKTLAAAFAGFRQICLLDNLNVYASISFEAWTNVVKDGMWMKLMGV